MKKSCLIAGLVVLALPALSSFAATITVPGTANPWLAGMPDGSKASGGDLAPAQSPVQIQGITLTPGRGLFFTATGGVARISGNAVWPPDGAEVTFHEAGAENGIAAVSAPFESLVGVFLGPNQPSLSSPPTALDFGTRDKMDYSILRPQLRQVFFIGDGRTVTGAGQLVIVPTNATRLFLGVMDRNESANNTGSFSVAITEANSVTTLEPIQWTISSGGNGHYYQYVYGKRWAEARSDALSRRFNGLPGYLANIASAQENAFLTELMRAQGGDLAWLGANDRDQEGHWVWADGPEAGLPFWTGDTTGAPLNGAVVAWVKSAPIFNGRESAAAIIGPAHYDGSETGAWVDLWTGDGASYVVEYSTPMPAGYSALLQREVRIADTFTERASTSLNPAALKFLPPAGDGRGHRSGLVIKVDSAFLTVGSMWEFDYVQSGDSFPGIQLIHPFKDGQCVVAIYPTAASLRTPQRWTEIGYRQPGQTALGLTKAADFSKIFPLVPARKYHIKSIVGSTGNVALYIDDLLVGTGLVTSVSQIDFSIGPFENFNGSSSWDSRQFSGEGFPLKWLQGYAGVIIEPVDTASNASLLLSHSPGPVPPPVITQQLTNLTVNRGETATLSVGATGAAPLQYNWFFGTNNLVGETDASLTLPKVTTSQAGDYKVVVSNPSVVTATSRVARLTVILPTPPTITQQPADVTVDRGQTATFTVAASGTVPIQYQWYFANSSLPGATNATLILSNVATNADGEYYVIVTNPSGDLLFSRTARLTVIVPTPPVIVQPPQDLRVVWGATVTFSVLASGSSPFQYEWSFNGATIPGETNSVLTVRNVTTNQAGLYLVAVSNRTGSRVTSPAGSLTVDLPPPPVISQQPSDATVERGSTASFTVTASGTPPLLYQWFFGGNPLAGETNAALALRNVATNQAGLYTVAVSNPSGVSISSQNARLTVTVPTPPSITGQPADLTVDWGAAATFTVVATGAAPLQYEWFFGTNRLVGEINATLTLRNVTTNQAGGYKVVIHNPSGVDLASREAFLTVNLPPPPAITQQPKDLTADWGFTVTFSVGASGTPPLLYQWFSGTNPMAGETNTVLTLRNVTTNHIGDYKVAVSNPSGVTVTSQPARLTVNIPAPPMIIRQPQAVTVDKGGTATFVIETGGSAPFLYQWFRGANSLPAEVSSTLTLRNVATNQAGIYRVVVSNPYGSVSSANALLTVIDPLAPPANDLFANRTVLSGISLSLTNSNANASRESGEPSHAGNTGGKSIWWTWTAPRNGSVTLSTVGSSADTVLAVYTGPTLASLVPVASNDDDPRGGMSSLVTFRAQAGVPYQIAVDTFGGLAGLIQLSLTSQIERPVLQMSLSGQNVVLSWPTNMTGFRLEVSATLTPAAWTGVSLPAVVTGETYSLKLPLGSRSQFYRLNGP